MRTQFGEANEPWETVIPPMVFCRFFEEFCKLVSVFSPDVFPVPQRGRRLTGQRVRCAPVAGARTSEERRKRASTGQASGAGERAPLFRTWKAGQKNVEKVEHLNSAGFLEYRTNSYTDIDIDLINTNTLHLVLVFFGWKVPPTWVAHVFLLLT